MCAMCFFMKTCNCEKDFVNFNNEQKINDQTFLTYFCRAFLKVILTNGYFDFVKT